MFDGESLGEPAQVKSVTMAQTDTDRRCRTHQLRVSKGLAACCRPAEDSRHTLVGVGVRREVKRRTLTA